MTKNPIIAIIKDMLYFGFETFGRYYSTYRAFVYSNADPSNLQRLQLIIPEVGGTDVYTYWAFPKGVFNGTGYGMQCIPQKGELVWVEFERGHPEVPIWSHGHFGNGEMPTNNPDLIDPKCFWFITPGGATVILNDTKKYISISYNGATFIINSTGLFTLKNGNTDIKTLLQDILTTYMSTTTISGEPLSPDSMNDALNNLQEVNKLFQ